MEEKLDNLAFSFFKLFAQYESYLKDHDYFDISNSGKIIVAWDRFVNENIGADFIEKLGENAESANFILTNPPMRQSTNSNGQIVWVDVPNNEKSIQVLFGHIRRARNNLFHGAKFHNTWYAPERNFELLQHGLIILNHFKRLVNVR